MLEASEYRFLYNFGWRVSSFVNTLGLMQQKIASKIISLLLCDILIFLFFFSYFYNFHRITSLSFLLSTSSKRKQADNNQGQRMTRLCGPQYILKYGIYFLVMRERLGQNLTSNRFSIFNNALFQTHNPDPYLQPQCLISDNSLNEPNLKDHRNSGMIKHQAIDRRPYTSFIEHRNKIFSCSKINKIQKNETEGHQLAQLVRDRSSSRKKCKIFEEYHPKEYRPSIKGVVFNEKGKVSDPRESKDKQLDNTNKIEVIDRNKLQQDIARKFNVALDKTQSSSQRSYQETKLVLQLKSKEVLTPNELSNLVKHIRKSGSSKPNNQLKNPTTKVQYYSTFERRS